MTYLACVLIALALHRLWNYEDIFARPRMWVAHIRPLSCPACNAFWCSVPVAAAAYGLGELRLTAALVLPLVAYPALRLSAWCTEQSWSNLFQATAPAAPSTKATPASPNVKTDPTKGPGCTSCAAKKEALVKERARTDTFRQRVAIVTNLADLTGPEAHRVVTQAKLLAADTGRLVQIWTHIKPGDAPPRVPEQLAKNIEIRAVLPAPGATMDQIAAAIIDKLIHLGNATVYTVDVMGVDLTTTEAINARVGRIRAFAWAHSGVPAALALPEHHVRAAKTPETELEVEALLAQAQPIPA